MNSSNPNNYFNPYNNRINTAPIKPFNPLSNQFQPGGFNLIENNLSFDPMLNEAQLQRQYMDQGLNPTLFNNNNNVNLVNKEANTYFELSNAIIPKIENNN
jgi:hypothetical protein